MGKSFKATPTLGRPLLRPPPRKVLEIEKFLRGTLQENVIGGLPAHRVFFRCIIRTKASFPIEEKLEIPEKTGEKETHHRRRKGKPSSISPQKTLYSRGRREASREA